VLLERYGYDRALAGSFNVIYAVAGSCFPYPSADGWRATASRAASRWRLRHDRRQRPVAAGTAEWLDHAGGRCARRLLLRVRAILGPRSPAVAPARAIAISPSTLVSAWVPIGQIAAGLGRPWCWPRVIGSGLWLPGILCDGCALVLGLSLRGARLQHRRRARHDRTRFRRASTRLLIGAGIFLLWSGQYFAMTWLPQYLVEARSLPSPPCFGYLLRWSC